MPDNPATRQEQEANPYRTDAEEGAGKPGQRRWARYLLFGFLIAFSMILGVNILGYLMWGGL